MRNSRERREAEVFSLTAPTNPASRPRVVIVGAGFAGLAAARALARADADVLVIDRRNHHVFQPLLYQVATAALSPADIAWPVRSLLRDQRNARVVMGRVTAVDRQRRRVQLEDGSSYGFEWLVLATGARHAYFGREDWAEFAPGLKKLEDATSIRRTVLAAFETAETTADHCERRRLTTFVVVGAGPTGVEMAGAISELARRALSRDYRRIDPTDARVILVEAGPRVLPGFSPRLSAKAEKALERLGVDVRLGAAVTECDAGGVTVGDDRIQARTVIWAAGVMASPAGKWLGAETDAAARVRVLPDLSVPGEPEIFVVGDTALVSGPGGRPIPGIAPAAKQMGRHVGRLIARRLAGRRSEQAFRYRDPGAMATIGRGEAIARIGPVELSGPIAWALWAAAHVWFLIGARSRMVVALNWAWSYVANARGARLITGPAPISRTSDASAASNAA